MKGAFITATGTGVGKTWLASALATACVQRGKRVAAIKPIETGVNPDPVDALALARACGNESLANAPGLYRAKEPLAPYAIEKRGGPAVGSLRATRSAFYRTRSPQWKRFAKERSPCAPSCSITSSETAGRT